MPEWSRTTLEMLVVELKRPVQLDESFERRVMVRVRRLFHEQRKRRGFRATLLRVTRRPVWAGALAAGLVAVATAGVLYARPHGRASLAQTVLEPQHQFVLVLPAAKSVTVVGDFNNWGLGDSALVATNHQGVWSVSASVPAGMHRYAFVVDGKQWMADPHAPIASGDDFGMPSSALVVEDGTK